MQIDPIRALELCGAVRYAISQIPGVSLGVGEYTEADRLRAIRALRPAVLELEELRSQIRGSGPLRQRAHAEQELHTLLSSVIDAADAAGVRTLLFPGQDAQELQILAQ